MSLTPYSLRPSRGKRRADFRISRIVAAIPSMWNRTRENVLPAGLLLAAKRSMYWPYCVVMISRRISSCVRIDSFTGSVMSGKDATSISRFFWHGIREDSIACFDSVERIIPFSSSWWISSQSSPACSERTCPSFDSRTSPAIRAASCSDSGRFETWSAASLIWLSR